MGHHPPVTRTVFLTLEERVYRAESTFLPTAIVSKVNSHSTFCQGEAPQVCLSIFPVVTVTNAHRRKDSFRPLHSEVWAHGWLALLSLGRISQHEAEVEKSWSFCGGQEAARQGERQGEVRSSRTFSQKLASFNKAPPPTFHHLPIMPLD